MKVEKPTTPVGLDRAAIFLSGLCLIHCLAIPFALLLGPVAGGWLTDTETGVHWLLLGVAVPVSAYSLWHGYRRHQQILTVVLGSCGLVLMFIGVAHLFGEFAEVTLTVIGVILLLIAHIRNLMLNHAH